MLDAPRSSVALADLVQEVRGGDEAAFRELYDRTHVRLTQVVLATVRSPEHTAEVVQELYLYLWLNAASFDEVRGSVLGWLAMLARRRAVDRVRHVVRANLREQRDAATADRTVPDVAEIGVARQEAAQLHAAVGRLSVLQRDAVALTFLHGYTHEQAARLLSVPLGTLKTRVRSGVINLRHHLEVPAA
ncbi:MAG TPA: sigma-70 family RNA polymerase sigma factor [Friedmanniella sp.]